MSLLGILVGLALLMWLTYRGLSIVLVAVLAARVAAFFSGENLLAHWTITFMEGAARFFTRWFPTFLLGGLFGKLMDDSGSIASIARYLSDRLGTRNTILSVVIASAIVTYRGVSVLVAFFVLVPMAQTMFRTADIPKRLLPATVGLGAFTFTMSAIPGTPSVNSAILMPYFGTTTFAAPGLFIIASAITLAFGLWWLARAAATARRAGEGYGGVSHASDGPIDEITRVQAAAAGDFDPAEIEHGGRARDLPPFVLAALPLGIVVAVNLLLSLVVLPRLDLSFLATEAWGSRAPGSVSGVWSVVVALALANLAVIAVNLRRLESLRASLDAGDNAAALPIVMISSLVGFGAVVAAQPAFADVRDAVLAIDGGPLISLTVSMNALAALTGTASGGMAIALNALGENFIQMAKECAIDPGLMHRVTTTSAGTLDALPHNGTVLLLLQISGLTHRESYGHMVMTVVVNTIISLIAVLILGSTIGSF